LGRQNDALVRHAEAIDGPSHSHVPPQPSCMKDDHINLFTKRKKIQILVFMKGLQIASNFRISMRYNIMDLRGTLLDNSRSNLPRLNFSILKFFQTRKSIIHKAADSNF
jgi:hypothetical protein